MPSIRLAVLIGLISCATAAGQTLKRVRVETANAPEVALGMMCSRYDVLEGSITPDSFELIVSEADLERLVREGYEPQLLEVGRPFREIQAERLALRDVPVGYPDLAQIDAEMNAPATAYPAICQVVDLTARYGTPATVEGRHLMAVKISDNVTLDEDEPAFLLVSAHHAREIVTPVIALHVIEQLTSQYGVDTAITDFVDEYEIWIAPVWNPDGYEYVFSTDNWWRKNRRVFAEGVGVDLNRNYPFGWDSPCGGSTDVTTEVYRGPGPASEAETQTMIALAQDRRFTKVSDLHSYGLQVRYGLSCLSYPFISFLLDEANDLAASVPGYAPATSCCTGGDFGYHLATNASHSFLWETATWFQPEYAEAQAEAAAVFDGLMAHLQRPIPLSGHVTDVATGAPVVADITYAGVTFENGETNASHGAFGRYHAFLPDGSYDVVFASPGYAPQMIPVDITADTAQVLNVALAPTIPTVSAWGAVVVALLLLAAGSIVLITGPRTGGENAG
jgi:hypothetical protein